MTQLTKQKINELEIQLKAREAELAGAIRDFITEAIDASGNNTSSGTGTAGDPGDEGDRGEYAIHTAMRHAEKERDQQELQQIDSARERMRDGSYGQCVDCGAVIATARLHALPSAERCIACQEAYERGHDPSARISIGA